MIIVSILVSAILCSLTSSATILESENNQTNSSRHLSLYHFKRHFYSHTLSSELRRFFDRPFDFVISSLNDKNNNIASVSNSIVNGTLQANETTLSSKFPLLNDANMMLYNWINSTNSSIPFPNIGVNSTTAVAKRMSLAEMFQYNTSWIIGLAVIATVIGVFFLGCVIVICYTRRPYRRSGKVYEIESTAKKSQKIPQVPTIHPATKTATLTRNKELYY